MAKVFVVTGGSRGIGAASALKAAEAGFDIALSYVSNPAAAAQVQAGVEKFGRRCFVYQADMGVPADIDAFFTRIDSAVGGIDVVFNNAGIFDRPQTMMEMSVDRITRMFAVNTTGAFIVAQRAAQRLSTRTGGRGGAIINMSSVAAKLGGTGGFIDYAASKGAIDTLTIGLAKELAAEGVRVNAVRPGLIDTDIHASAGMPDRINQLKHLVPMQRGGTADEVADVVVFLASDRSSYVTGQLIDIAGGRGL